MREFKFRLWDKYEKEMVLWEQYKDELVARDFENEELVVMQYTGLEDKNGKEIYECDIVTILYEDNRYIGAVGFDDNFGQWRVYVSEEDDSENLYEWAEDGCEVIGNIFENLELLGVTV